MTTQEPRIVQRIEQPYVAVRALVTMQTIGDVLPAMHPKVRDWLRSQGVQPAGQPFFKYNVIDMARQVEVEVGFPVAAPVNRGRPGARGFPAGRYATLWHTGHPNDWPARPKPCSTGPRSRAWPGTSRPRPMASAGDADWRFITTNPART